MPTRKFDRDPIIAVDQIRREMAQLEAHLAIIAGEPLPVYRNGDLCNDTPDHGFLLEVSWAVSDASYTDWYASIEGAKAALLRLARQEGAVPSSSGLSVDLTSPGCHSSRAWINGIDRSDGVFGLDKGEQHDEKSMARFARALDALALEFDLWSLVPAMPPTEKVEDNPWLWIAGRVEEFLRWNKAAERSV